MLRLLRAAVWIFAAASAAKGWAQPANPFRIMTFNVWHADETGGVNKLIEIMRLGQAANSAAPDVIGLQEMEAAAGATIAGALGFHYHQQSGSDIQILSRYPIVGQSPANCGAEIALPTGQHIWVFNAHMKPYPYQPEDLRDNKIQPPTEANVIAAAAATRGPEVTAYLGDMAGAMASGNPIFLRATLTNPRILTGRRPSPTPLREHLT